MVYALQRCGRLSGVVERRPLIYFMNFQENPAVFRMRVADGKVEQIADIKTLNYTGNTGMWMGVDPSDAPLFLRDLGTRDVYALSLNGK